MVVLYRWGVPPVTWGGDSLGDRQTENYWLRNRRMFESIQGAVKKRDPKQVLVIVGRGHKHFLDELTREAGYRWVDPRRWLPHQDSKRQRPSGRGTPSRPAPWWLYAQFLLRPFLCAHRLHIGLNAAVERGPRKLHRSQMSDVETSGFCTRDWV
jgi:hypothetical protein